jgi:hypothetical protein
VPVTKYANQTLENQSIDVDESYFVNCVLKECDLFFSGGDFEWQATKFENCRWHFRGSALRTFNLLTQIGVLKQPQATQQPAPGSPRMN